MINKLTGEPVSEEMQNVLKRLAVNEAVPESEIYALKEIKEANSCISSSKPTIELRNRTGIPVSYTHLDVYKRQGLKTVCFTEHMDMDYPGGEFLLDAAAYRSRLVELREEFRGRIEVLFGVEDVYKRQGYDRLLDILEEKSYDEVVCALDSDGVSQLSNIVEACELTGTKISVIPSIYKYMSATPAIDMVGDIPLMNIRRIPLDNMGNAALKRALDIVGSLVLLILTSPVILVSMLIIKITMGGKMCIRDSLCSCFVSMMCFTTSTITTTTNIRVDRALISGEILRRVIE